MTKQIHIHLGGKKAKAKDAGCPGHEKDEKECETLGKEQDRLQTRLDEIERKGLNVNASALEKRLLEINKRRGELRRKLMTKDGLTGKAGSAQRKAIQKLAEASSALDEFADALKDDGLSEQSAKIRQVRNSVDKIRMTV